MFRGLGTLSFGAFLFLFLSFYGFLMSRNTGWRLRALLFVELNFGYSKLVVELGKGGKFLVGYGLG